jgi:uncharacterized protein
MGAPVTWFEINTGDPQAAREFYAALFGWQLQVLADANYALVDTGGEGIGGGIGQAQGPNQVIFYIDVDDPQVYLDRVEQAGGKTLVPITEIPDMVTFAQFSDPQGNVVGLVKSS